MPVFVSLPFVPIITIVEKSITITNITNYISHQNYFVYIAVIVQWEILVNCLPTPNLAYRVYMAWMPL